MVKVLFAINAKTTHRLCNQDETIKPMWMRIRRGMNRLAGVKCSLNLKRGEYMASLISQVSKLNSKQNKSEFLMIRISKSFKTLLLFWVKQSGSKSMSDFIRKLVLSATMEQKGKGKQLTKILNTTNEELKNHD